MCQQRGYQYYLTRVTSLKQAICVSGEGPGAEVLNPYSTFYLSKAYST